MIAFGIKDVIDIFLVASLLFYVYRLMKESRSLNIFVGIMLFVLIWLFVSQVLEMRLLGSILDKLVSVGVIALIVIFQEDIRRFLYEIGSQKSMRRLVRFFHSSKESQKEAKPEKCSSCAIWVPRISSSTRASVSARISSRIIRFMMRWRS